MKNQKTQNNIAKEAAILQARGVICDLHHFLSDIDADLADENENVAKGAAIAIKAIELFMGHPGGFKHWVDMITSEIDESISKRTAH